MNIARAILTHRQDLIPQIQRYYLKTGRTKNLIIAYNQASVDPKNFEQTSNFRMFPYFGKGPNGNIYGQMFLVWGRLAKAFPEIDMWVIHDYDVIVKPADEELAGKISEKEYGMVGKPFVYNQETIKKSSYEDLYPFLKSGLNYSLNNSNYKYLETELLKKYPVSVNGQDSVLTGYGDFIVAAKKDLELLIAPDLEALINGGSEQVPHTVFGHFGIKPYDFKKDFSCFVSLDNAIYADFDGKYDISHPSKFWPGAKPPTLEMRARRFLKLLLTDSKYIKHLLP